MMSAQLILLFGSLDGRLTAILAEYEALFAILTRAICLFIALRDERTPFALSLLVGRICISIVAVLASMR
jgi:hypothetical protein